MSIHMYVYTYLAMCVCVFYVYACIYTSGAVGGADVTGGGKHAGAEAGACGSVGGGRKELLNVQEITMDHIKAPAADTVNEAQLSRASGIVVGGVNAKVQAV
jgi:hypothetical protein